MTDNPLRALVETMRSKVKDIRGFRGDPRLSSLADAIATVISGWADELESALAAPAQDSVAWAEFNGTDDGYTIKWLPAAGSFEQGYLYAGTPPTPSGNAALVSWRRTWEAVANTLSEVAPGWDTPDGTCDMDRACNTIRALAGQAQATQPNAAMPFGWAYTVGHPDDLDNLDVTRVERTAERATIRGARVFPIYTQPQAQDGVISDELDALVLRYGNERAHGLMDDAAKTYTEISCRIRPQPQAQEAGRGEGGEQ